VTAELCAEGLTEAGTDPKASLLLACCLPLARCCHCGAEAAGNKFLFKQSFAQFGQQASSTKS